MKYQRNGWSVEQGIEKGRPPPDWYMNEPYVPLGCGPFIDWFWGLATERPIGFGGAGPIPQSKIWDHCSRYGFDFELSRLVLTVMTIMDNAYLEEMSESRPKSTQSAPAPPSVERSAWPKRK